MYFSSAFAALGPGCLGVGLVFFAAFLIAGLLVTRFAFAAFAISPPSPLKSHCIDFDRDCATKIKSQLASVRQLFFATSQRPLESSPPPLATSLSTMQTRSG